MGCAPAWRRRPQPEDPGGPRFGKKLPTTHVLDCRSRWRSVSTGSSCRWRRSGGARPSGSPSTTPTRRRQEIVLILLFCSQRIQVFFEARKKLRMRRLKELAAAKTADQLPSLGSGKQLAAEGMIPAALVYDLTLAYLDTWTTRFL